MFFGFVAETWNWNFTPLSLHPAFVGRQAFTTGYPESLLTNKKATTNYV
jgi:hypothetical protein